MGAIDIASDLMDYLTKGLAMLVMVTMAITALAKTHKKTLPRSCMILPRICILGQGSRASRQWSRTMELGKLLVYLHGLENEEKGTA